MIHDHLGHEFSTKQAMCNHYGISRQLFTNRQKDGKPLEECLQPVKRVRQIKGEIIDHLGNKYKTMKELAEFYNITVNVLNQRIRKGYSMKEVLTGVLEDGTPLRRHVKDHKGNIYDNTQQMCAEYGVHKDTYFRRRKEGLSIEVALTAK